jgi:hypothetical protein
MTLSPRVALHSLLFTAILTLAGCSALFSVETPDVLDFATLVRADSPNQFIVCPTGKCPGVDPDRMSRKAWDAVTSTAPRTDRLATFLDGGQVVDVQRSAVFKFPGLVTTEFFAIGERRSTLAIYSRAVYGLSDFGMNEKRITRWLHGLESALEDRVGR